MTVVRENGGIRVEPHCHAAFENSSGVMWSPEAIKGQAWVGGTVRSVTQAAHGTDVTL